MSCWTWMCSHHHAGWRHVEVLCELRRLKAAVCQQTRLAWGQCLPMQTTLEPPTLLCRRTWPDWLNTTLSWDYQMFRVIIEQLRHHLLSKKITCTYGACTAILTQCYCLYLDCTQWAYWCCIKTAVCWDDCNMCIKPCLRYPLLCMLCQLDKE